MSSSAQNLAGKRKVTENDGETSSKKQKKETCPHGPACYRRNPHHFREYEHPHLIEFINKGDSLVIPENLPQSKQIYMEQIEIIKPMLGSLKKETKKAEEPTTELNSKPGTSDTRKISKKGKTTHYNPDKVKESCPSGSMMEKLQKAAPYNIFFTTISKAPETLTQPNAITFTDLLCPSLGVLKCSLQINFMIDIDWLMKQYQARDLHKKPLTIIYGDDWPDMEKFINMFLPNVSYKLVKMKDPFGVHHSKVGIYVYEDLSLRVVVSTANLYYEDWNYYNQGMWVSPTCTRLPDSSSNTDGESPTGFKSSLLNYLKSYDFCHLKPFIEHVERCDFSHINVFLTYSVPGTHYPQNTGSHLLRVADLLSRHCSLPPKTTPDSEGPLSWSVTAQASSIGSLGKQPADWLRGSLLRALASHKDSPMPMNSNAFLNIVYPSVDNVMNGYYGAESGGCLPYSKNIHDKQKWLKDYLYQWKASAYGRSRAMPHIKTYCRISPCLTKLAYFLLTSCNISKAGWGGVITKNKSTYVRSYEVGVLFLPKFFNEEFFKIQQTLSGDNKNIFPFMYDLPLIPYRDNDYPWCN